MKVYCTSKNQSRTSVSYQFRQVSALYLGTDIKEAEVAVPEDFYRFQREDEQFPHPESRKWYTAIPSTIDYEMIQFYHVDGWWYSIVMFNLEETNNA